MPNTGYSPPQERPSQVKLWTLHRHAQAFSGRIQAVLYCDSGDGAEARALIHCNDEEELEWLKNKVEGTQRLMGNQSQTT